MAKIRRTIALLLLICCVFSMLPAFSAGADFCVHVPDAQGRCTKCGTLLVTESYSAALGQTGTMEAVPETVSVDTASEEKSGSPAVQISEASSGCSHVPDESGCCKLCGEEIIASGDGKYFSSVQDAFACGGNIRLLRDIDSDEVVNRINF